jgi:hypothetical protein
MILLPEYSPRLTADTIVGLLALFVIINIDRVIALTH